MTAQKLPCGASHDCLHLACEHCGVLIRTSSAKAGDHPGTRAGKLKTGQCGPCERRGGPPPATPKRCKDCRKPFRSRSESLEDRPGTVRHEGHGQCVDCFRNERRAERAAYDRETHRLKRKKQFEAQQHEIAYEGHIRMSDTDMERIKREYPEQYEWHMLRRRRIDDPEFRQRVYKLSRHDGRLEELMSYDQH